MSMALWCAAVLACAAPQGSTDVMAVLAPTEGGLTVDEVVRRAVDTSPAAMKSREAYNKAAEDSNSAYLLYVPRIDVSGRYYRQKQISPPAQFGAFSFPATGISVGASISIPASDYFLRIVQGYDAAKTSEAVARFQLQAAQDGIAIQAIETFLNAVRARAEAQVSAQSVEVLTEQLSDTRQLADAGLSTQGDVLQIKAQVASARVVHTRATGAVQIADAALRRALHDSSIELRHADDLMAEVAVVVPDPPDALATALESRPELESLRQLIDVQEELAKIERAGLFPRITLDGSIIYAKPNQQVFFDPLNFYSTWQVGINLAWSPNDAVSAWSNWNKADADIASVQTDILGLTDAIAIEVTTALTTFHTSRESIAAAKDGLEASLGAFEDRQNLLAAGSGTTRELLLAEQDLRNARLQMINAHLDLRLARAQLDRAMGRLRKGDDQ